MKYNFDNIADRRNTNQVKWMVKENELPMWVADMDFKVLPEIEDAIKEVVNIGAFGYATTTDEYFDAYIGWWKRRHNIAFRKEWMMFSTSVIASLDTLIRNLTKEDDNVVMLSPIYNAFYNCIKNYNRNVVESYLIRKNNGYVIDFSDLERKLSDPKTTMFILCNPHNPIGKIWSKDEIERMFLLCEKYNVRLISDEIHCDIVSPGKHYVPVMSVNEDTITLISGSKVFNIAGIQSSVVVIKNKEIHDLIQKELYKGDNGEPNAFAVAANIAAFTKGDAYVDELNEYLENNKEYVSKYIKEYLPNLTLLDCEATYLLWIDISYYSNNAKEFTDELRKETGLFVCAGELYGSNSNTYFRLNIATSLDNVKDAMDRLNKYVKKIERK